MNGKRKPCAWAKRLRAVRRTNKVRPYGGRRLFEGYSVESQQNPASALPQVKSQQTPASAERTTPGGSPSPTEPGLNRRATRRPIGANDSTRRLPQSIASPQKRGVPPNKKIPTDRFRGIPTKPRRPGRTNKHGSKAHTEPRLNRAAMVPTTRAGSSTWSAQYPIASP